MYGSSKGQLTFSFCNKLWIPTYKEEDQNLGCLNVQSTKNQEWNAFLVEIDFLAWST